MNLILWRHAEAKEIQNDGDDLGRSLTPRGLKQAARMAVWLNRQMPDISRILVSPARRTEQTVLALGRKYKTCPELLPHGSVEQLLELADWPHGKNTVLIVGHQPVLGQTVAQLMGLSESECAIKKGAVWWLRNRERDSGEQTVIVTVQSPEVM